MITYFKLITYKLMYLLPVKNNTRGKTKKSFTILNNSEAVYCFETFSLKPYRSQ